MGFLRHIGKNGDRKVAVVFREVPGEPHMCLVTYTETLNQHIHDPLIQCIESDIGQNSENLADALNRTYTKDGRPILQVLHVEGQLKKAQTSLIMMTPAPNVKIRLSELNTILDEMKQGEAAVKKLADMDNSRGIQDPADIVRRMRGDQTNTPVSSANGALDDNSIAGNLRNQADKMVREAKGLMAEAARIMKEAASLDPVLTVNETKPVTGLVSETKPVKKPKTIKTKTVA